MAVGPGARYVCGDEERRAALQRAIANGVVINGIDFLEVIDSELAGTPAEESRQRVLLIQCFTAGLDALTVDNVRIDGGVRIQPVHVRWVAVLDAISAGAPAGIPAAERQFLSTYRLGELDRTRILAVGTEERGDFSTYRLSLVEPGDVVQVAGFDPRLFSVEFSFKVECPSDFDCKPPDACPPPDLAEPEIDYLAKDYLSFRRLMLDRMAAIIPEWQERNPADLGVMLVETLAYVGDQLSYAQDAAATEAYLGTARQRISVRRHARLVDYLVGEGANARAWVFFEVEPGSNADGQTLPAGATLLTRASGRRAAVSSGELLDALRSGSEVFETMTPVTLRASPRVAQPSRVLHVEQPVVLPADRRDEGDTGRYPRRPRRRVPVARGDSRAEHRRGGRRRSRALPRGAHHGRRAGSGPGRAGAGHRDRMGRRGCAALRALPVGGNRRGTW
jgi:hypothetical protein